MKRALIFVLLPLSVAAKEYAPLLICGSSMNNKPAISLYFGENSESDYFEFSMNCDLFDSLDAPDFTIYDDGAPAIKLTHNKNGVYFPNSSKFGTHTDLKLSVNKEKRQVVFNIGGTVLDIEKQKLIKINPRDVVLSKLQWGEIKKLCAVK
ncbi:hypothetical protein [Pasteurella multocida]|uniref:hypothetical protein n=1 Tax=Pasteurella multocida TaxID=747 RepID=UPI002BBBDBAB|nr:hypothetical protein [Pasteurella multocida]MEB3457161.1 hypothetical protein [Pasteurella multocida]